MKKVLVVAVLAGLGFTSCSSKNDCECTQGGTTFTLTEDQWESAGGTGDFKGACEEDEDCKLV
jgi:hypothetical protein